MTSSISAGIGSVGLKATKQYGWVAATSSSRIDGVESTGKKRSVHWHFPCRHALDDKTVSPRKCAGPKFNTTSRRLPRQGSGACLRRRPAVLGVLKLPAQGRSDISMFDTECPIIPLRYPLDQVFLDEKQLPRSGADSLSTARTPDLFPAHTVWYTDQQKRRLPVPARFVDKPKARRLVVLDTYFFNHQQPIQLKGQNLCGL